MTTFLKVSGARGKICATDYEWIRKPVFIVARGDHGIVTSWTCTLGTDPCLIQARRVADLEQDFTL